MIMSMQCDLPLMVIIVQCDLPLWFSVYICNNFIYFGLEEAADLGEWKAKR